MPFPDSITDVAAPEADSRDPRNLRQVERRHVREVLHDHQGNKVQAAKTLGISRRGLYRLIEKYGLEGNR